MGTVMPKNPKSMGIETLAATSESAGSMRFSCTA